MKKLMILIIFTLLFRNTALATPIIIASPSDTSVSLSESVSINYLVSNLSSLSGGSLSAFDLDILFDTSLLAFTGFSFTDSGLGNQLDFIEPGSFGFFGDAIDHGGIVDVFGISGNSDTILDTQQANEFVFLTLTFNVINHFTFTDISIDLTDLNLQVLDSTFNDLNYIFESSLVRLTEKISTPNSVPTPNSLSLLLLALALCLYTKRVPIFLCK